MKKRLLLLLALFPLLLTGAVTDYAYRIPINIANSGEALTDKPICLVTNPADLIAGMYMESDANDIAGANAGGGELPTTAQDLLITDACWWLVIDGIANGQTKTFYVHTGFPAGTRAQGVPLTEASDTITITDAASLDVTGEFTLGANDVTFFAIPNAETALLRKPGAYELGVRNSNEIYARVVDAGTTATTVGTPTGAAEGASGANLIEAGCSAGSQQDCISTNDGDTSYVYSNTSSGYLDSYYTLTATGIPTGSILTGVTGTAKGRCVSENTSFPVKVGVRIGASESEQTITFSTTNYVTRTTASIGAPGGGSWEDILPSQLQAGQIKLSINTTGSCPTGGESRVTWVYLTVTYYPVTEVTYSPIAIDTEYDIAAAVTGGTIELQLDGAAVDIASTNLLTRTTAADITVGGAGPLGATVGGTEVATDAIGGMFGVLPTYQIAEECLSSDATSHTFTLSGYTIPSWAVHLVIGVNARTDRAAVGDNASIRFNADTGANYNGEILTASGASATAARSDGSTSFVNNVRTTAAGAPSGAFGNGSVLVPEFGNTSRQKVILTANGNGEDYVQAAVGRWASVAAITSVTILPNTGPNFVTNSCFTLAVVDERYNIHAETLAGSGTFDVTGIPAFTGQLVALAMLRSDSVANVDNPEVILNGDTTSTNYARQVLSGTNGSATATASADNQGDRLPAANATTNAYGVLVNSISQFAEATNDPHMLILSGVHESTGPTGVVSVLSMRRNNVAAINQYGLKVATGPNYVTGSSLWLYMVPQVLIQRVTVGAGGAATISFASIPQDREALTLHVYGRGDTAATTTGVNVQVNADNTAANYDLQLLDGDTSTVTASQSAASQQLMEIPAASAAANVFGGGTALFPQYVDTDHHKLIQVIEGSADDRVGIRSMRWESTAAITDLLLTPAAGNFAQYTVAELWGMAPPATSTYAVQLGYEPEHITEIQRGTAGNGWTYTGTVDDLTANNNDGAYNYVRTYMEDLVVTALPLEVKAAIPAVLTSPKLPDALGTLPDLTDQAPVVSFPGKTNIDVAIANAGFVAVPIWFGLFATIGIAVGLFVAVASKSQAIGIVVMGAVPALGGPLGLYEYWIAIMSIGIAIATAGSIALLRR